MAIFLDIVAALLFVGSSGLLFNARFRENAFLVICAGLIALASTYFLTRQIVEEVVDEMISERLAKQQQVVPTAPQTAPPSNVPETAAPTTSGPVQTAQPTTAQPNLDHTTLPPEHPTQPSHETAAPPQATNTVIQLTESNAKDIWSTSVYSYAPGGGGPGGGLANDRLRVGGWGDQYVALIQFDLPDVACTSKMALELYNTSDSPSPTPMYLYVIRAPWDWQRGDRLWWKDLPAATAWDDRIIPAPGVNAWLSIDISDIFAKWCTKEMPNYGIMLKPIHNNNNFDAFVSTRYAGGDGLGPRIAISN
jgi:hypothetical protein